MTSNDLDFSDGAPPSCRGSRSFLFIVVLISAAGAGIYLFCSIYFPYGVSLPKQDGEYGQWNWFPKGSGKNFTFNKSLEALEPFRDQVTVLGGLSHPKVRRIGGHDSGDTFLTGEELSLSATGLKNSISLESMMIMKRNQIVSKETFFKGEYSRVFKSNDNIVDFPLSSLILL